MNQKSNVNLIALTFVNLSLCLVVLAWLFSPRTTIFAQAQPPDPFLGPIYYGTDTVNTVFDHWWPYLSLGQQDPNDCTQHYDGSDCLLNPPFGLGYDEHDGIDYGINYKPVLAAADGVVYQAGWANESNHRDGLGLRVRIEHDNDYRTEYGHLSIIQVQTGDPANGEGIIGISGNTGNVAGSNCDPDELPTCGAHLHFGLINPDGIRVNPYGWIGAPGTDPWELALDGAPSYDVWLDYPSITQVSGLPLQFPDGVAIPRPAVNNARMIIDDGSADFVTSGPCTWNTISGANEAYNNAYRRVTTGISEACMATWYIKHDAFTPAGEYDLFVHIPQDVDASLGVEYTVQHNGESTVAVIAQASYVGNDEHDAWAYLGRYDFAMDNAVNEFVRLDSQTIISDSLTYVLFDAIMLSPAGDPVTPQRYLYVSFAGNGYAGNVPYSNEDILLFDGDTGVWRLFFDGSDIGLDSLNLDAFTYHEGDIYFSLNAAWGGYDGADIIRFAPTSPGDNTSGTISLYLDGSTVGLNQPDENIDAFSFDIQERSLVSAIGPALVKINPNANCSFIPPVNDCFADEDIFAYDSPTVTPPAIYFDGSDVGLTDTYEDVDAISFDMESGEMYLSTERSFVVNGSSGDGADILVCTPGSTGQNTTCTYWLLWNGSAHGIPNTGIDGLTIGDYIPLPGECGNLPLNCSFEEQFANWEEYTPDPANADWEPTMSEAHSGWYSAMAVVDDMVNSGPVTITSSLIPIQSTDVEYRFSFYGKGDPDNIRVVGYYVWNNGESNYINSGSFNEDWSLYSTAFMCPPDGASTAKFVFYIVNDNLTSSITALIDNRQIFIDDVRVESRPNANCPTLNSDGD